MLAGSVWDALIVLCQTLDIQKGDVGLGQLFSDGHEAMDGCRFELSLRHSTGFSHSYRRKKPYIRVYYTFIAGREVYKVYSLLTYSQVSLLLIYNHIQV